METKSTDRGSPGDDEDDFHSSERKWPMQEPEKENKKSISLVPMTSSSKQLSWGFDSSSIQTTTTNHSKDNTILHCDNTIPTSVSSPIPTNECFPISPVSHLVASNSGDSLYRTFTSASTPASPFSRSGSPHSSLQMEDWRFNKTHQFQTKTGYYRSISQYDSHIKEIRGKCQIFYHDDIILSGL